MNVYVIPARKKPYQLYIDKTRCLPALQALVDGYVEACPIPQLRQQNIILLADDESILKGKPLNVNLYPFMYAGDLVAVGTDGEDFCGLSTEQVIFLTKWLQDL